MNRKILIIFLAVSVLVSSQVYAQLSPKAMKHINEAVETNVESEVRETVAMLAEESPATAMEIAEETARIAPKNFACAIIAGTVQGSQADAEDTANIIGAVASAIGSSGKGIDQIVECVAAEIKIDGEALAFITEMSKVVALGFDAPPAAGTEEGDGESQQVAISFELQPPLAENPGQDISPQ